MNKHWLRTMRRLQLALGMATLVLIASRARAEFIDVTSAPYNAVGDGITDDTAAIQAAINAAVGAPATGAMATNSGGIYLPLGTYKITATLRYQGNPSLGFRMEGDLGGTRGPTGSLLTWHGASGGTMFYGLGVNGSLFENVEFDGRSLAKYVVWFDAKNDTAESAGSSGIVLRRLTLSNPAGTDSAALAFGHAGSVTSQVSEVDLYDLHLQGNLSTSHYGIKTLNSGNTKNYKLTGGSISGFKYGVDWQSASGVFGIHGVIMGAQSVSDFRTGTGQMIISHVESESAGIMFVVGSTGSNPGSLVISGSSFQGSCGADDVLINYSGNITLTANTFFNTRTSTSYPKIVIGGDPLLSSTVHGSNVVSFGNWYRNAPQGSMPLFDGSGNGLYLPGSFYGGKPVAAVSVGDYGGLQGGLFHLTSQLPFTNAAHQSVPYSSSITLTAHAGGNPQIPKTFVISANNSTPFTINNPVGGLVGQIIHVRIRNVSGGALGAVTLASAFKKAGGWVQPASGANRTWTFEYDGTSWVEISRTAADVPN